jgi:hypothetical protein
LAGKPVQTSIKNALPVLNKYTQKVATSVSLADETAIKSAIASGVEAEEPMRVWTLNQYFCSVLKYIIRTCQVSREKIS